MHIRSCDTTAMYFHMPPVVNILVEFLILALCVYNGVILEIVYTCKLFSFYVICYVNDFKNIISITFVTILKQDNKIHLTQEL